jgi:Cu(I)/Ag(I) efflux system membrane fusion protein
MAAEDATRRRNLALVAKVVELRLRFVVLMAGTGLAFFYWDTIINYIDKWQHVRSVRHQPTAAGPGVEFFCPMDPSVVREESGQCPICGMPLARRRQTRVGCLPPAVLSRVRLTPGQIAQAGIRTARVGLARPVERQSAVGSVGYDESRRVVVASEAQGRARIDRLHVAAEGEHVQAGQCLAELYSYDVAQSIRVLVEAARAVRTPAAARPDPDPEPLPLGDPQERFRLAAQALHVLGVRPEQVEAIVEGEHNDGRLPLLAPISGLIIKKRAYQGEYVTEGTVLFEIADLGHVWLSAQVFEDQVPSVRIGQSVEATVPALPGAVYRGRVARVAPALDPATHTASVRFDLENHDERLRPRMFATVTLDIGLPGRADALPSVPESAVVDTGASSVVYVETSPGIFEGRAVVLGPRSGEAFAVLEGLAVGERIAATGAFLIDAETRLNPATRRADSILADDGSAMRLNAPATAGR